MFGKRIIMKKVGYKIKLLYNRIRSTIEKNELFQKSALTRTEFMVLSFVLSRKEMLCMRDIQEHFNINRSSASELLTSLESKKFVEKIINEEDTRIKYIKVTCLGKKEHTKITKYFAQIDEDLLECLTEEEKNQFVSLLDKIINSEKKGEMNETICMCKNKK